MATKTKPAATEAHTGAEDAEQRIESAIGKTEQFIYDNGKKLLTVVFAIVIVAGGWMAYKHLYQAGRADKASAMMYVAQQNLAQKMWDVALNGDGNQSGFLDVISTYGGTPQGNVAKHYAGECYLRLGQFDEALNYLGQYRQTKGVPGVIVNAQNYGLRGDVYVQQGKPEQAVEMYGKAVAAGDDPLTSPMYLKKMGLTLISMGRGADATDAFQRILDFFPDSMEGQEAEKYIGIAEQL